MADSLATLADPTDFGNKPGDGPYRVGGQPGAPERDANKPSTRSPQAAAQVPALTMARDLWRGTDALRLNSQNYLPKSPGEDVNNYRNRLMRSVFFNAFRRTVDGLTGLVFRKDPKLGEDVPAVIRGDKDTGGHWENLDLAGTHGDVFCRYLFEDALIAGHAAVLVEFPATGGAQTARAELTGELRPYWVPIKKDDIMSWRTTSVEGRLALTQVVLRERTIEPVGEFGMNAVERYRVLSLGEAGLPEWRLLEEKEGVVVQIAAGVYGNQSEIPLAEIVTSGRDSMFVSDPPLKDLGYLNVAHYQIWSDQMWSAHKTCVPFLFGSGIVEATDPNTGLKRPFTVGANTAVLVPEPGATMDYVSHDGASLGAVKAILDDLKSEMGTLGLEMLAPQKRAAETAQAKQMDKATSDSSLAVSARGLQDGLERALGFHARYLRLPDGGSIEINRDFEGILMESNVMSAFAQLVGQGFPPRPVLEALQGGGRIDEDEDLDALEMEWLAGTAAKQAQAAEDAQMNDAS